MLVSKRMKTMMMGMTVDNLMRVGAAVVRVPECVNVSMFVFFTKCLHHCENRSGNHDHKGDQEFACKLFAENHERKESPDERCDGIISTCFRRPDDALRPHIKEDAQAISHETEHQHHGKTSHRREFRRFHWGYVSPRGNVACGDPRFGDNRPIIAKSCALIVLKFNAQTASACAKIQQKSRLCKKNGIAITLVAPDFAVLRF